MPKTDYLLCQNFRVDRDGKLVSRYGYPLKFSFAGGAYAHTAAVAGGIDGCYYVAANDATGAGAVYCNFNASPIATGLSGGRVGFAYMNGWMWIMDALVQGKHQFGGALTPWGLQAPTDPCAAFAGSDDATGPSGTYQFYVTFMSKDGSCESNPGPVSASVTVAGQDINLSWIPTSPQTDLVGARNIYATGGTLGLAYLVGTINDNVTAQAKFNTDPWPANPNAATLPTWNDLSATDNGQVMPTTNDPPPPASGMVGPYFSRLIAWKGSRLFWTDPDLPQYWPGAADESEGNWVDVGIDGEQILWCTMHTNVLVIYKERSIWRLVGDPDTGYLEIVYDGMGLANPWAVTAAGPVDYLVAQGGLYRFNLDRLEDMSDPLRPLFTAQQVNAGALTAPGSILAAWGGYYGVALGYAMGKLYVAYAEASLSLANPPLMVYSEEKRRWAYHRTALAPAAAGFRGFVFDGLQMVGLTGDSSSTVAGYSLDDFRAFYAQDEPQTAIECVYQSHFEDAGLPDNQKNWLEVVIDYELGADQAGVYVLYDNAPAPLPANGSKLLSLTGGAGRQQVGCMLGSDGVLAKNISILIDCLANHPVVIHNVYLYYYEEARLAVAASTIPIDLGVPKVKQCKELQLDIDASLGPLTANLYSDLPGNQLQIRHPLPIPQGNGRTVVKYPFPVTEGFLWRVALTATYQTSGPFRLYAARLLMRVMGVYVEAYEAAAGFVWDSMELTFESGLTKIPRMYAIALAAVPIKRFREISMQIDTFGGDVTLSFLTDLPGDALAVQFQQRINTGAAGRRFVRCMLPSGIEAPIEGRMCRIQLSGASKFVLYEMAVELIAVGVYIEQYEAQGGGGYDSREMDFGEPGMKEAREIELDIETTGSVSGTLYTDGATWPVGLGANTTGRQKVMLALTANAALEQFAEGRLLRLLLWGTNAFRLYGARIKLRPFGMYLTADETANGALWDSTDLDLGSQTVKQLRELELDIWAYGNYTVTVYTDLPGNAMASRVSSTQLLTSGRTKVQIPLPQGSVPDNYIVGRLVRVTITSAAAFKLFGARIHARPFGVYVEAYEAKGGAVYDSHEIDLGTPAVKEGRELELDIETTGAVAAKLYSDLVSAPVTGSASTTGRQKVLIPLTTSAAAEQFFEARLARLMLSGVNAFRLYGARLKFRPFGQYLTADETTNGALWDSTELDLGSQTVKQLRELDLDIWAYGAYTVTVFTDLPGNAMEMRVNSNQAATSGRTKVEIPLPQGTVPDNYIFGRLVRVTITSSAAFKLFGARIHARAMGVYVESYEAQGGAVWDSTATDLGSPNDKTIDQVRVEMDSDGVAAVNLYTDLPGETMASRGSYALTTGASSRHWATAPLGPGIEGRSARLVVASAAGFRIYRAQVRSGRVGRYLAGTGADNISDALNTLEFDFRSERTKLYKKIEIDLRADAAVTLEAFTNQFGAMGLVYNTILTTPGGRQTIVLHVPPAIRGKLFRLILAGGPARVYKLRVWTRPMNEEKAGWSWEDYPLEDSDVLPAWTDVPVPPTPAEFTWSDLPVPPTPAEWQWAPFPVAETPGQFAWADLKVPETPAEWQWAPFPVNPTEPQWFWAKVLSVEDTPETWTWVDVPFAVNG